MGGILRAEVALVVTVNLTVAVDILIADIACGNITGVERVVDTGVVHDFVGTVIVTEIVIHGSIVVFLALLFTQIRVEVRAFGLVGDACPHAVIPCEVGRYVITEVCNAVAPTELELDTFAAKLAVGRHLGHADTNHGIEVGLAGRVDKIALGRIIEVVDRAI